MQLNTVSTVGFYEGSGAPSSTDNINLNSQYLDVLTGLKYILTVTGWVLLFDVDRMTVIPDTSSILPASIYYSVTQKIIAGDWDLSNLGLTHFDAGFDDGSALSNFIYGWAVDPPHVNFNLSGNALPTADLDLIVSRLGQSAINSPSSGLGFLYGVTFDFTGGTNGTITGGSSNAGVMALGSKGATVLFNP